MRSIDRVLAAVLVASLASCGSTQAAAPVTTTVTAVKTVAATTVSTTIAIYYTVTQGPEPTNDAVAPAQSFPDGSYLIGSEMPAGNYTAAGGGSSCVWVVFDSTHTGVTSGFGRIATLPASDYSFESAGCGTWTSA